MICRRRTTLPIPGPAAILLVVAVLAPVARSQPTPGVPTPAVVKVQHNQPTLASRLVRREDPPQGDHLSDGIWTHGNGTGRPQARGLYKNGLREGLWTRFFWPEDGPMFTSEMFEEFRPPFTSEAPFKSGALDGKCTIYDAEHRRASEWEIRDNVPNGSARWFYPDGTLHCEAILRDGCLDGDLVVHGTDQEVVEKITFVNGFPQSMAEEFHAPGVIRCRGLQWDIAKRRAANFDWWRGLADIEPAADPKQEVRQGLWTWFYETGSRQLEGSYEQGLPTGKFTWWYDNGQRQLTVSYAGGKAEGSLIAWYPSGQRQLSAPYRDGKQCGAWTRWNPDGKLVEKSDSPIEPLEEFIAGRSGILIFAEAASSIHR